VNGHRVIASGQDPAVGGLKSSAQVLDAPRQPNSTTACRHI
jgi:hypothetical protein